MGRRRESAKASGGKEGSWALRRNERPRPWMLNREPLFGGMEDNAVFRAVAYTEHARSRRSRLRANEYTALLFAALFGFVPLLLGFWPAAPLAALLVLAIYLQVRARERREALGHFFQRDQGLLKDLMLAGLPVREWSVAFWARHTVIQQPYWILGFNVALLVGFLGLVIWAAPFWVEDPWIPMLLCAVAFSHMFSIAWYNARLRYRPWVELPAVLFQPRAFRLSMRYLKRIPPQIDQARVAVITQFWVFAVMAAAYVGVQTIRHAEWAGRLAGWRETAAYDVLTFPPLWLGPGLFLGSVAGMLWGWRCQRRSEERLEKLDEEIGKLLELIRQRSEGDGG